MLWEITRQLYTPQSLEFNTFVIKLFCRITN